jgi:hypothetical protein
MRKKTSGSSSQSLIINLNRFGREKNRTEPKLICLNRFSVRFGSVQKIKKSNSVWLFILIQNRTEPEMLSPNATIHRFEYILSVGCISTTKKSHQPHTYPLDQEYKEEEENF